MVRMPRNPTRSVWTYRSRPAGRDPEHDRHPSAAGSLVGRSLNNISHFGVD